MAVLAIFFYHAGVEWMPGGFLGVDVFFTISGFPITSLLLAEFGAQGWDLLSDHPGYDHREQ